MKNMNPETCAICHNSPCTCGKKKMWMILSILGFLSVIGYLYARGFSGTQSMPLSSWNEEKDMKEDANMQDHNNDKKHDAMMMENKEKMMSGSWTKEEMEAMKKDHMMSGSDMDMHNMPMTVTGSKITGYINYDEAKIKDALTSGQKVALFFHATWCPSCRALDDAISANLSSIPTDALIVKVDYDTSTEMKKQYGVTSQHTIVIVDKDMNLISKKIGPRNIGEVLN